MRAALQGYHKRFSWELLGAAANPMVEWGSHVSGISKRELCSEEEAGGQLHQKTRSELRKG